MTKEERHEYNKRYYQLNKGKILKHHQKYYLENKEKISKYQKKYREKNREKIISQQHKWYQENKDLVSIKNYIRKIERTCAEKYSNCFKCPYEDCIQE